MNRVAHVNHRLSTTITDLNCIPSVLPESVYREYDLNNLFRFGWIPPVWVDEAARQVVVGFCPEVIAASGSSLVSDEDFLEFIEVIEMMIVLHVAKLDEIPDAADRHRAIENELLDRASNTMTWFSTIQLAALDAGVV